MTKRHSLTIVFIVIVLFGAVTARLFVWPAQGMPARVDAIVELASEDDPTSTALRLAQERRARFLVISLGTRANHLRCPRPTPQVKLTCFYPSPATTQGEVEFAARLAARHHWHSLALVTTVPQATRARLRLERCFPGHVYAVTSPISADVWPWAITYEWGALLKALVLQRSC